MAQDKPTDKQLSALRNEIQMALKLNEQELEPIFKEAIQRYTGEYVPRYAGDWDIILNEVYPVIQNNLPSIFFRNPRAFLKPKQKTFIAKKRNPETGKKEDVEIESQKAATTQEAILNYSLGEMKYKKQTQDTLLDALLAPHGVLWHGYKGEFGMTEENSLFIKDEKTFVKRISPMRFIKDPAVSFNDIEEGNWVGRVIDVRLDDLIEDDKLDVDKKIKGFHGFGEKVGTADALNKNSNLQGRDVTDLHRNSLLDSTDKDFQKDSSSHFVKVYEIFLRPTKKQKREGSKGWIILLTDEQSKPLRVSPWNIKAEGWPAKVLQFNPVPDRMFGIADITTYAQIADQKNIITNLQIRNAQENTKVWVGISKQGAGSEDDVEKIVQGDNTIILFDGDTPPRDRMFVASPGGQASNELYLIDQRIQRNLEDKSGVSDLKRGFLQSGEESATSVKIRSAGSNARPLYRQDIMKDFLTDSLHYLNQLNKQFLPVKDAVRIVGSLDLEWSENPSIEEIQADTDVEVDAISMLPENPEQELQSLNQILGLAVQSLSDPGVIMKLKEEGKMFNLSPLVEQVLIRNKIKNPEIFRNIRPEESQGFVSVAEIRAAKANIEAALQGNPNIPSPPAEGQDHMARLEVYSSIAPLLQQLGNDIANQIMAQVFEMQQALMQEEQSKEARPGLKPGGVKSV